MLFNPTLYFPHTYQNPPLLYSEVRSLKPSKPNPKYPTYDLDVKFLLIFEVTPYQNLNPGDNCLDSDHCVYNR